MLKQKTLKDSFSLSGKGLHTGLDLTVTFNPAPDNHGYKIQRTDLEGQPIIDAVADNVTETTRGTVLSKNAPLVRKPRHDPSGDFGSTSGQGLESQFYPPHPQQHD